MAYVPPALRVGQESRSLHVDRGTSANAATKPTVNDIQKHFWPRQELTQPAPNEVDDDSEESPPRNRCHSHSTLNGTQDNPDFLRYVLLFAHANPQWRTQQRIYAKTNLQLLPAPALVDQPSSPIMVFSQGRNHGSRFEFLGYHMLTSVQFYEPHTPDLVQMLERKFTIASFGGQPKQVERDTHAWQASLGMRWAELQMKRDPKANRFLKPPPIAATPLPLRPPQIKYEDKGKSVNELLREMRLDRPISDLVPNPATFDPNALAENLKRVYDFDMDKSQSNMTGHDEIDLPPPPSARLLRSRSSSDLPLPEVPLVPDQVPQ